ncbi:hypothetical protein FSP39_007141 [Pinctada imbricata]|uniref:Homeobox domain-containing protein n=1 Tax=Pinctada imbricata TaxID=66713 RepID=A0AA88XVE6_PINIB|nr:hypothetical protein FSP39_007141 [Pinctada imbricata]
MSPVPRPHTEDEGLPQSRFVIGLTASVAQIAMESLKRRLSFRKKKNHVPECSKPHQWQEDEKKVRDGTCSFQVRVILGHGNGPVTPPDGLIPLMGGAYHQFPGHPPRPQDPASLRWPPAIRAPVSPSPSGQDPPQRSEDEDDDDSEYRPFTPPPPRERLSYTRYQLELLNGIYNHVRYPNSTQKQLIAKRVGITREQVKIWFQNRRRKDVVNKDKPKTEGSPGQTDSKSDNGDSDSGVSDTGSGVEGTEAEDDPNKSMVPNVVLKSVIAELNKFDKDFKPKKKKKKSKAAKEQKSLKEKYTSALINGGFDFINPPNQVVPSASAPGRALNHSSKSSAFQNPKDSARNIANFFESLGSMTNPGLIGSSNRMLGNPAPGCDLPVLSDLLRSNTDQRNRSDGTSSSANPVPPGYPGPPPGISAPPHGPYTNPLGYFYPYPFIAEPAFMLSSMRHHDSYRNYGHGVFPPFGGDANLPFQTLCVSQLSNPYFSNVQPMTPLRWSSHNQSSASSTSESSYEQL